jgi:carbon-monoxide dehydrogenase small subunit
MTITFTLNGQPVRAEAAPGQLLLEYLRAEELHSVKYGCGHGECGSCSVLIDDRAYNACLILMHTLEGKRVETLESFGGHQSLTAVQDVFLDEGAIQCGYCTPGMLVSLEALLRGGKRLSEDHIREALAGNLCRCTGYVKPIEAVKRLIPGSQTK